MPTEGGCLCGEIRIAYSGEPIFTSVCYCDDCRKMANTQVFQILKTNFEVTQGEPKIYTKRSDHGNEIHSHFCPNCGTTLFRTGGAAVNKNNVGIRAGVLDDQTMVDSPPTVEVYVEKRPPWIKAIDGAVQLNSRYERI
ncbi:Mss4-like protein [Biscogniauxia mediterranea]|nr:Mss4-like protein [Biscogniauxia mediterranea]KAI1635447.1 Mss4-like protein [Biscogniauxia mediterranea]